VTFANNRRLPDNAIYHFCQQAKKYGVDIFRIFDALNDVDQLEVGMKAVQKAGGVVEGTLCYSGDSKLYFRSSFYPVSAYQEYLRHVCVATGPKTFRLAQ